MTISIHEFKDTQAALDECSYANDRIRPGDILLIRSEKVIGIADTYPVAITINAGALHEPSESPYFKEVFGFTLLHIATHPALQRMLADFGVRKGAFE